MNEIPEDIFTTAFAALSTIQMDHVGKFESWDADASLKVLTDALMAERERCAKIADEHAGYAPMHPQFAAVNHGRNSNAKKIAAAIRSPAKEGNQ